MDSHTKGDDGSSFLLWTVVTPLIAATTYWLYGGLWLVVDLTHKPEAMYARKIQPNVPLDRARLPKLIRNVLWNQLVIAPALGAVIWALFSGRVSTSFAEEDMPGIGEVLIHLLVSDVVVEVLFFYIHWAFHSKSLYRYHKVHHEWPAPIALAAVYCHSLEFVSNNLFPVLAGPLLLGSHIVTVWVVLVLGLVVSMTHHCGYDVPFHPWDNQPRFHDAHHSQFDVNFGLLGILDRLHGTTFSNQKKKE